MLPTRWPTNPRRSELRKNCGRSWRILARYRVPVMFLTGWTQFSTPLYHGMPLFADVLAEWFPEVPIIITKMGRGYSFIFEMALAVAYKHPNVYFDIVQAPPEHIERGVRGIGRRSHHVRHGLVAHMASRGGRHLQEEPAES